MTPRLITKLRLLAFGFWLAGALSSGARADTASAAASAQQQLGRLQYHASAPGTVARPLADKLRDVLNFRDFGGKCDGTSNDDRAMDNALSHLASGTSLVFPAGTCVFTTPKTLPLVQNVSIRGAGARQTVLLYTGKDTRSDLWTVGDGKTSMTGWSISGLRFDSTTTMSAGAALHLRRMQNGNELADLDAGVFTQSSRKLFNGIWLDDVNVFKYSGFNLQVQNEALMLNGAPGSDQGSDVYLDNGAITFSKIAYHVGGGQGGVYFGKVLAFGNGVNYQIDTRLVARRNREIFFSDQSISDGATDYGVWINDALTSNAPIVMNGAFASAGQLQPGGKGIEIYVEKWPAGRITMGPGQLYNATRDGMRVDDPTTIISIDAGRHIFHNGGYGVNATVPTSNLHSLSQYMAQNRLGDYSPNVQLAPFEVHAAMAATTITNSRQTIDKAYLFNVPADHGKVEIPAGTQTLLLDPAAPLDELAITLPACNAGYDGSLVRFSSTRRIARLALRAAGGSVAAPPAALAAGAGHQYLCRGENTTWYPLY
ncbi:glycosyl hydrolase family 28-related protein [Burkholderia plantarii]|uniref:glycosyl hydrolase family 28-related protein n=1 Tax=Burkholderia plantarii TaxID=41899 RepID=UPI0006D8AA17|nr:glycosyl hydrolase family 28-related protein [Burkholderia plantarii]ALK29469.1 hypothetical protein bpln_1g06430 [Burkholderia plantarii]WLE58173.1 hypothetical protein GIY62_13620 [Burkholderia plantarii]GLZ21796.1 hypothetical protein Bpla01_53250 [Burkholderia plantarii]